MKTALTVSMIVAASVLGCAADAQSDDGKSADAVTSAAGQQRQHLTCHGDLYLNGEAGLENTPKAISGVEITINDPRVETLAGPLEGEDAKKRLEIKVKEGTFKAEDVERYKNDDYVAASASVKEGTDEEGWFRVLIPLKVLGKAGEFKGFEKPQLKAMEVEAVRFEQGDGKNDPWIGDLTCTSKLDQSKK